MKRLILIGIVFLTSFAVIHIWHRMTRPRWLKCALHTHTTLSDGVLEPDALKAAYARRDYDVLAITDHDVDGAGGRYEDMLILPGNEVTQSDHHMVLLGTPPDQVRILAHPSLNGISPARFRELLREYDGFEIFTGAAAEWGATLSNASTYRGMTRKPGLAVDDAHGLHHIGAGVTWVYARPREDSILEAIRRGRVRVETRENVK